MAKKNSVSIYDIATDAGVSAGTVSRVINGHPTISDAVREKIIVASRKRGFIPRKRVGMIAVAVGDDSRLDSLGYIDQAIAALAKELRDHNYIMQLTDLNKVDFLQAVSFDAVIGVIFEDDIELLQKTFSRLPNLPVITVNRPLNELGYHSFSIDHRMGAREATELLIGKGHQRIAFIEAKSSNWGSKERLAGYKEALENAGIEYIPDYTYYSTETMLHDIVEHLKINKITGVVNCSEDIALDFSHYLTNILKIKIPEDMSVVTVGIGDIQRYMSPPQTVIQQPLKGLIKMIVSELGSIIKNKENCKLRNVVIGSEIVERNSVTGI
jgi:DNA-binding LacI/PurR family transcriptional regulator